MNPCPHPRQIPIFSHRTESHARLQRSHQFTRFDLFCHFNGGVVGEMRRSTGTACSVRPMRSSRAARTHV